MADIQVKSPGYFEDRANAAEAKEQWDEAEQFWIDAADVSLGRGRRERYLERAKQCREKSAHAQDS